MDARRSAGRLPGELNEFVGRRAELARVRDALEGARLVTLTGPGGIGKTRLALQVASGARRAFDDGVWLAELGGLRDPGLLVNEVARSLGLSDRSARWAVASLADYLQAQRMLLVLDQCEHLADDRKRELRTRARANGVRMCLRFLEWQLQLIDERAFGHGGRR